MSSKFDPYLEEVKNWRASGKSWREISEELEKSGVKSHRATIQQWFSRRIKQALKITKELEALDKLAARNSPNTVVSKIVIPSETRSDSTIIEKSDAEILEELEQKESSEKEAENPFNNNSW